MNKKTRNKNTNKNMNGTSEKILSARKEPQLTKMSPIFTEKLFKSIELQKYQD